MHKQNSILRKQSAPYTTVSNELISDKELYLRDKGLYVFMFSKPEGWSFSVRGLAAQVKEGKTSVSQSLKRLIKCGWLKRYEVRADGRYTAFEYEIQAVKSHVTVSRKTDTLSVKPDTEKRTLSKSYSKKEREGNFGVDKKAIDAYIDEVVQTTKGIKSAAAYKRKLIEKFMCEDRSTLYAFERWKPSFISRELQSKYYGKECRINISEGVIVGTVSNITVRSDGGFILELKNTENGRYDSIAILTLDNLNEILEAAQ